MYTSYNLVVFWPNLLGLKQTYENETRTKTVSESHKFSTIAQTTENVGGFLSKIENKIFTQYQHQYHVT